MHNLKRMFGQRVLPIVYDDSLSYYEMICKMMRTINQIIENDNLLEQYVGAYMPTFNGDWDVTKTYQPLSVVLYDDQLYIAKQEVPVGISIEAGDYWEEINLPYFDSIANLNTLDVLIPDQFTGTDSEKINAAFDACAEDGGTICINRKYDLDNDVVIAHLSSRQKNFIHVIGLGKNAEINLNGHHIIGSKTAAEAWGTISTGGVFWTDVNFTGNASQNGFICDLLIRMFFENCHFYGMNRAFYGNDTMEFLSNPGRACHAQSYYFNNCYFGCCQTNAFDVNRVFDCHFNNCIFEYDNSSIKVRLMIEGLYITNCLIENIRGDGIIITTTNGCWNLVIRDTYFEDNDCSINLSNMNYKTSTVIDGCMVALNATSQYFIHMPRNLDDKFGLNNSQHPSLSITNNAVVPTNYNTGNNVLLFDLFRPDGSSWQYFITGLTFENNNFELTDSNASAAQLFTLNYRPKNKTYTRSDKTYVTVPFNSDGTQTATAPADIPFDSNGLWYEIETARDIATGANICRRDGVDEDPNTWYYFSRAGSNLNILARRDAQNQFVIPIDILREQAGGKFVSFVIRWKFNRDTAPGNS